MRLKIPHPLVLLSAGILLAAAASYVIPAGSFERRQDEALGREVVVAGTYHRVAPTPVTPFQVITAVPLGMLDAAEVIFFVFLIGGAFTVVEATGALRSLVDTLLRRLANRKALIIPVAGLAFAMGGILIQTQEELIAFVPVLLLLCRRSGFDRLTAVAMSLGVAAVGAAFSPVNPFQVVIAQQVADLPIGSGKFFRILFLIPAVGIWLWATARYARRHPHPPEATDVAAAPKMSWRHLAVLTCVLTAFGLFLVALRAGWDFNALGAMFFVMGVLSGLLGGLKLEGTADAFVEGFRAMAYAALLIGFARGIYVVLNQGHIIDTIVATLFSPLAKLPLTASAAGMMGLQSLVHVAVPSTSGQAVLTMPLLVPLSDLLGLSRQVTVLAYQYGAGLCELLTPTNGALMAMIAAAGVKYEEWLRFALPVVGILALLGLVGLGVGVVVGI